MSTLDIRYFVFCDDLLVASFVFESHALAFAGAFFKEQFIVKVAVGSISSYKLKSYIWRNGRLVFESCE